MRGLLYLLPLKLPESATHAPVPGAHWHAVTWASPPHDARAPRYTHARLPQARDWVFAAVGTTREASKTQLLPVIPRITTS